MSKIKQLASETAIYGLSSIVGRVVNWIVLTPFFTRIFLTDEYGIVNEFYFYIAALLVLFTYRMETAYFRFASRSTDNEVEGQDRIFTTASLAIIGTTAFFTILLFAFSEWLAALLDYPGRGDYVRVFTLIIAFDALAAIPFAKLRMDRRPLYFAAVKLGSIFLNIGLVFFFFTACPYWLEQGYDWVTNVYDPEKKVIYVFWANLLASGVSLLFLFPLYRKLAWHFATDMWRSMLAYALPLVIAALAGIVNQLAGTPLLKFLGPGTPTENLALGGIFAAAAKLAVLMNLFVQAFNYAAEPFFFRQSAITQDKTIYADVARAFALVGSLAFLGIMLYLEVIRYFLGEDFRYGLGILPIMLVANFFLGLYYNFSIGYKLTDQTQWAGYIAIGGAVITLLVNLLLIPQFAIYAPAWGTLACFAGMAGAGYWLTRRLFPVPYAIGRMGYYLGLAVSIWILSEIIKGQLPADMLWQLAGSTICLVVALIVLWQTEKQWLKRVIQSA